KQYAISENYAKGFAEGEARGHQEGLEEGRRESVLELAKAMKAKGLPMADIADITGLQVLEIESL
ncbi:MAG: hypothetical protein NC115_10450, partial [Bacteroidales bacterium]|nr:hypothetical protein [Bacteroidales bacterium]